MQPNARQAMHSRLQWSTIPRSWQMFYPSIFTLLFLGGMFGINSSANAHTMLRSYADLKIKADGISATLDIHPGDFDETLRSRFDQDRSGAITYDELISQKKNLSALSISGFRLFRGDERCEAELKRTKTSPAAQSLRMYLWFPCSDGDRIRVEMPLLQRMSKKHTHFLTVNDGETFVAATLNQEKPFWETPGAAASLQQAWHFFILGLEHILIGYDHLLFLFALLVVCIKLKSLVLIVTAFTIAHSLTLALAYFKIVELPAAIVESAIALSIVFVAIENCVVQQPKKRWLMTFLLGLIHGLGFAGVLRELAVPTSNRIISLLTFNLGVEVGQVLLVAAFFPLLFFLSNSLLHKQSSNAQKNASTGKELGMRLLPIAALTTALYFVNPGTALAVGALAPLMLLLHRWLGFRVGLQIGSSLLIASIGLFWFIERAILT
ncbi:MAG: hypothetical protein CMH60_06595 [Myxococcales bacterium]|nr:hypothetical protein [Myxococcales bacterium]